MKKTILYLCVVLFASFTCNAQEFNVGTNVISGGIGLGGNFGSYSTSTQAPGFSINYERGVWDVGPGVVSLGGYVGTKTYKYKYSNNVDKWSYTIVGVKGAYHYNGFEVENLDVYGGVLLSYNILSYSGLGSYGSRAGFTGFLGGRWYFTDSIAVFAEAGYGVAYLTLGISFRF